MAMSLKRIAAAVSFCTLLLAAPTPAAARVTISIEVVYGGVAGCGLGLFFYFAGSWEVPFAARNLQSALLEISDGRARVGVPVPSLRFENDPNEGQRPHDTIQLELLHWRF